MASARQIEANQRNAKFSRGPRTSAGKAAAAKNALRHGLLSEEAMLPGESALDYARFTEKLYVELNPIGELESALVGRIGGLLWRLKRIGRLEAGILMWKHADLELPSWSQKPTSIFSDSDLTTLGETYQYGADSLAKLSRYETSIERSMYKALHELQRLQAARKGDHVPAPVVVDVNVTEP
ncbi:MAG: hypothetical protein LAO55_04010 [Acidobacteriia bacterium]|nr:hypothetical protein [Terriglobia bacterium]